MKNLYLFCQAVWVLEIFRYAQDELSAGVTFIKLRDNIAVDQHLVCHTEQSEVSLFCVVMRFNAFGDVANARCEIKTSFISLA